MAVTYHTTVKVQTLFCIFNLIIILQIKIYLFETVKLQAIRLILFIYIPRIVPSSKVIAIKNKIAHDSYASQLKVRPSKPDKTSTTDNKKCQQPLSI